MLATDDILKKLGEKDQQAFELLFKGYYQELCRFAYSYVKDRDVAEGLVQDMFYRLWQKADQLAIRSSLRSYLYQSVRNSAFNHIKHQQVKQEHQEHVLHQNSEQTETASVEIKELQTKIDSSIASLPEKCRQIFLLSRQEGKKYKVIADELGISVKTVENQMGKALKVLRNDLGDYLPITLLIWIELMT